jgi:tol-pal system protein YbgF
VSSGLDAPAIKWREFHLIRLHLAKTTGSMAFRTFSLIPALLSIFPVSALAAEGDAQSRIERLERDLPKVARRMETAQLYNRPPVDIDVDQQGAGGDPAGLTMRIDRLERELRQLTGRIEEIQHDIQRLDEQARRLPPDAAIRPANPSGAALPPVAAAPTAAAPAAPGGPLRRGDAFDPSRDPNAAGAPRPLGSTPPSAPLTSTASPQARAGAPNSEPSATLSREPGAPLDITHGRTIQDIVGANPPAIGAPATTGPDAMAALPNPPGPKDEYEIAVSYLHKGQYETAEKALAAFIVKNPKGRFTPGATFYLGESYFLRGRHREAAEKYLEISAKYASSPQAPDALLRLGQSLNALGAREQACASFSEIGAKYPNASARVKDAAQRESKKVPC